MKRTTLDTKGLRMIARKLATLQVQVERLIPMVFDSIYAVERNHQNIVAAHKAHTTMAKQRVGGGYQPKQTLKRQDPPRGGSGVPR